MGGEAPYPVPSTRRHEPSAAVHPLPQTRCNSRQAPHPEGHGQALCEVEGQGVQDDVQVVVDDVRLRMGRIKERHDMGAG